MKGVSLKDFTMVKHRFLKLKKLAKDNGFYLFYKTKDVTLRFSQVKLFEVPYKSNLNSTQPKPT